MDKRKEVIDAYLQFYKRHNYPVAPEEELLVFCDPSLEFRNCTICRFKERYITGSKFESYVSSQKCIRINNFKDIHSEDERCYRWSANLTMLGGFQTITNDKCISDTIFENIQLQKKFLLSILPSDKYIEVFILKDLLQRDYIKYNQIFQLESERVKVKVVSNEQYPLTWKYDLDGIRGLGTEWIVRDINDDDNEVIFGDVILLLNKDNPIGIDFGGGLEVLIQSIEKTKYKIFHNDYSKGEIKILLQTSLDHCKLIDSLSVIVDISYYMIKSELTQKTKFVFNQYLKAAVVLIEKLEIYPSILHRVICDIIKERQYIGVSEIILYFIKCELKLYREYLLLRTLPNKYSTGLENSFANWKG